MKDHSSHIKQLCLNVLTEAHFFKKPLNKMYAYYEKNPSFSGFEDIHMKECINIMKVYPIHEKFGLSLTDLMSYDPDDIQLIKQSLENDPTLNDIINSKKK